MPVVMFSRPLLKTVLLGLVGLALLGGISAEQVLAAEVFAPPPVNLSSPRAEAPAEEGLALYGKPKYAPGFTHFDDVRLDAPKGGTLRLASLGTFDTLNPFTLKGIAAPGAELVFATLMTPSLDEPFSQYGLVAESVRVAPDRQWVSYHLRPTARFSDETPILPEDVMFSFTILRDKGHPSYRSYYRDVASVTKIGPRDVLFTFKTAGNRELPLIVGQLPILPEHAWKGRDFAATTLTPLIGSGPYRVDEVVPGRSLALRRVTDWWGADLPTSKGRYNFDVLRYDIYRDATVALEAFLAGKYDVRMENIAKNWATAYTTDAVKDGRIVKREVPNGLPAGMQAFVFNTRRPLFQDRRVREALGAAFNFEWANMNIAYGLYTRTTSYFENSDLAAQGLPSPEERTILAPYRDRLPPEVFTHAFAVPKTDGQGENREGLKRADSLLREAGWVLKNGRRVGPNGEVLRFEILDDSPAFERWVHPWIRSLARLGVEAQFRLVDSAQFQNRLNTFDFDVTVHVFPQSLSPGNEQRDFWGSANADRPGSRNMIGIKDPVVDALAERIPRATTRAELITLCRALDRVLSWGFYVVPHWHTPVFRVAFWKDRLALPANLPPYGLDIVGTGWAVQKAEEQ